ATARAAVSDPSVPTATVFTIEQLLPLEALAACTYHRCGANARPVGHRVGSVGPGRLGCGQQRQALGRLGGAWRDRDDDDRRGTCGLEPAVPRQEAHLYPHDQAAAVVGPRWGCGSRGRRSRVDFGPSIASRPAPKVPRTARL